MKIKEMIKVLDEFAPLQAAGSWDNTGLLIGHHDQLVTTVMGCLTITSGVIDEALEREVNMIISHHPLPFSPLKKITGDLEEGSMVLRLCAHGISVYSPHTALDQVSGGIGEEILRMSLGLRSEVSYKAVDYPREQPRGVGKMVDLCDEAGPGSQGPGSQGMGEILARIKEKFNGAYLPPVWIRGRGKNLESKVSICAAGPGVGSSLVTKVIAQPMDLFITGELRYHEMLALQAAGIDTVLLGHYASERHGLESFCRRVSAALATAATASLPSPSQGSEFSEPPEIILSESDRCPMRSLP